MGRRGSARRRRGCSPARGAKVVVADLQEDKGKALADELGGAFAKVDVTNTDEIIDAVEMAKSIGPVRVLVNSAGIGWAQRTVGKDGTYESAANLDAFKRVIDINLIGTFDCIRIAATAMSTTEPLGVRRARRDRQHRLGRRVRRADRPGGVLGVEGRRRRPDAARRPRPRRHRRAGQHRRPRPDRHADLRQGEGSEAFKANLQKGVLFPQRLGFPEELASMVVECVTNSYMNAETIRVDGGIRMPPK